MIQNLMVLLLLTVLEFWGSVILTGNQTGTNFRRNFVVFWSSVILIGNQTMKWRIKIELTLRKIVAYLVIRKR